METKMFSPGRRLSVINLWILCWLNVCLGFYLPGLAPVNYCREGDSNVCKVGFVDHLLFLIWKKRKREKFTKGFKWTPNGIAFLLSYRLYIRNAYCRQSSVVGLLSIVYRISICITNVNVYSVNVISNAESYQFLLRGLYNYYNTI